jgi:hypothetical protein
VSGVVWARYPLAPQSLCSWALIGLRLACVGRRWPLVAFVWPVGAEMGDLDVVGVEMRRWGVETRGWEPKHVVEGQRVHYRERTRKIKEKTRKITKKNTPTAQTMPDASFGLVVVVATPKNLLVLLKHKFNLRNNG